MFIKVENLLKSLGGNLIFSDVNLMLTPSHKYGIIGKNGSGKSTFLKLLTKEIAPDKGVIHIDPPNANITYFSQVIELDQLNLEIAEITDKNILEPTGFVYLLSQNKDVFSLWKKMNFPTGEEDFSELVDLYTELGGYELEGKILRETKRLGIDPDQSVKNYSGGQKTRLQLAKLFIYKSEVLLLDEPTNHLDMEGLDLFYDFVKNFKGILLITSHDRNLLTDCVNKIILFENKKVTEYSGNYEFYQNQKLQERVNAEERFRQNEKKVEKLNQAAKKLTERISKHEEKKTKLNLAVERTARLSKKNKAAKTRIIQNKLRLYKDNDKMAHDFLIQKQQRKLASNRSVILDRAKKTSQSNRKLKVGWSLKLDFDTKVIESNYSVRTTDLTIGFSGKALIKDLTFSVGPNQKIAITGPNGIGKTTLLKTIAGEVEPLSGVFELSPQAKLGYLDQENLNLDKESTVLAEFLKDARELDEPEARNFLHFFLFEGEMPLRKVKTLSEGEKVKLKLAKLLYSKANILLLDEPTNHLDLPSQEVVEKSLKDFEGALLLITHDKVLIKNLGIQKVLEL